MPLPLHDVAAAFLCSAGVPACDGEVTMRDSPIARETRALQSGGGDRGNGAFLNSVSSTRFRLGSQERAPRECPSRALLGPNVREGPMRECPQQRRERHVRLTPEPRVVNRTREGCLTSPQKFDCLNPAPRCAKHIKYSACRPAPFETAPAGKARRRGPAVRGAAILYSYMTN